MEAAEHIERITLKPKEYYTLGLGTSCWAVVNHNLRDEVVLLERPKEMQLQTAVLKDPFAGSTDRMHMRATGFARAYDRYLIPGLQREDGGQYQHSTHLSAMSPKQFGTPKLFHLGRGALFPAHSVRVVQRIQGTALDFRSFAQPSAPLGEPDRVDALAKDIAHWLFTVHHKISPKAIAGNKIEKQFSDAGVAATGRFEQSEKYKLFVPRNLLELETMQSNMANGTMQPEIRERIGRNLQAIGASMPMLVETARVIADRLRMALATDRYGLIHSDVHPGNIIVDSTQTNVNGVCDWANGAMGPQSTDFAGLGIAKGLLPKVMDHYGRYESQYGANATVNREAVYGMAAMRQLFLAFKQIKYGDMSPDAQASWRQVNESVNELRKIDPKAYRTLGRNLARGSRLQAARQKMEPIETHPIQVHPGVRLSP